MTTRENELEAIVIMYENALKAYENALFEAEEQLNYTGGGKYYSYQELAKIKAEDEATQARIRAGMLQILFPQYNADYKQLVRRR